MAEIKRVCAWCGKIMGYKQGSAVIYDGVTVDKTHGICEECERDVR
jgi:hypothetical protein